MNSSVEMADLGEHKGLDWLGIPGTNGDEPWEGGMPFFDFDGYSDFGTTEDYMPYYRADDQYQMVVNMNWLKLAPSAYSSESVSRQEVTRRTGCDENEPRASNGQEETHRLHLASIADQRSCP